MRHAAVTDPRQTARQLMDLGAWTKPGYDPVRRKRLFTGYGVGAVGVAAFATFVALTSSGAMEEKDEEVLDIALATEPEAEPEPEPEPEQKASATPLPKLATPALIPDSAPEEAEPTANVLETGDDPFGHDAPEEAPKPEAKPEPPKPKPQPVVRQKAKPKGPIRVTENVTPPVAVSQSMPGYPESAKAQGIEGLVIVRYVVDERGQVTEARALRGPAELRATCEAAVKSWKFQPAVLDGQAVSVVRITRFPFRLTT